MIQRRITKEVTVGNLKVGGNNPIYIQSMSNIPVRNVDDNVAQVCILVEHGCEIVRFAITSVADIKNLYKIKRALQKKGILIPLVADVHFSPKIAIECLQIADKVRINPGNFANKAFGTKLCCESNDLFFEGQKQLKNSLEIFFSEAKKLKKSVRIGLNHGSISTRISSKFGHTPRALWESAKECLEAADKIKFNDIILSFKASDVQKTIESNRIACTKMDALGWNFPIHLGVTEAGNDSFARIKSAIGIGALLLEGIGDSIRVSLTENPVNEIETAKDILQACGVRRYKLELISCPSCGRTSYDIQSVVSKIKTEFGNLYAAQNLKIAVMGCMVNGLGEAASADFSIVGQTNGYLSIFQKERCIKRNIAINQICRELAELVTSKLH